MSIRKLGFDAWENVLTGLGRRLRDKREGALVKRPPVNNSEELYEYLYQGDDVAARIAEIIPREMTREWIDLSIDTNQDESSELRTEDVSEAANLATEVLNKLDVLKAKRRTYEALVFARVYGNGALFLGIDDGNDPAEPLDEDSIRSFDFITAFDRWELRIERYYQDFRSPDFGMPEIFRIVQTKAPGFVPDPSFNALIHESRMVVFDGTFTTRRRRRDNGGWADSIYSRLESVIRDYSTSFEGVAAHLQDWGQFVYKMRGLADALASDQDKVILDRIQTVDITRSMIRAILLDADAESVERIATPAAGIDALLDRMSMRLAQAAEMPLTLLQGRSPAGENATGESDIQFFYDQIRAKQESELRDPIEKMIRLILKSADGPTRGLEPENYSFEFRPLWQMDDKEKAEVRLTQAQADAIYLDREVVTADEVAHSRFGGDRYSTDTQLDMVERDAAEREQDEFRAQVREDVRRNSADKDDALFPPYDEGGTGEDDDEASDDRADQRTFEPPDTVRKAAQRGLDLRRQFGRGGTDVGIARARDLAGGKAIPVATLRRMKAFFDRHEGNKDTPPEEGNGMIAWLLWGGSPGRRWAESSLREVG